MNEAKEINTIMLRISGEHKIIFDYVVRFDKALSSGNYEQARVLIRLLSRHMQLDLIKHFELEEKILFPAALLSQPEPAVVELVLVLQKEHGLMKRDFQRLGDISLSNEDPSAVIQMLKSFLDLLKQHTNREVTELFPWINKNPPCMALIEKYIRSLGSDQKPSGASGEPTPLPSPASEQKV